MRHYTSLLCLAVTILGIGRTLAQRPEPQPRVTSVRVEGKVVRIVYDLNADPNAEYRVELFLLDEKNPSAPIKLKQAQGDIGEGSFVGVGKTIVWDMVAEGIMIEESQRYRFQLNVTHLASGGGLPWYVYAGGAAVAGAAVLLLAGGGKDQESQQTPQTVPLPPPR